MVGQRLSDSPPSGMRQALAGLSIVDDDGSSHAGHQLAFRPVLEDLTPFEFLCRGPGGSINRSTHKRTGRRLIVKSMKINRRLEPRIKR